MDALRQDAPPAPPRSAASRSSIVAATMLLLIGGFYLLREHWSHVAGLWPYLLLLGCPLMHLLHGHGSRDGMHHRGGPAGRAAPASTKER